jgi:hypothetical protein
MPGPPIKRYALVPKGGSDGIRRFQLARVSGGERSSANRSPERLARMEEIAERDRRDTDGRPPG